MNDLVSDTFKLNTVYGLITIQGPDTLKFLQGILTCDINNLREYTVFSNFLLGAFCNIQGRMRALFKIFQKNNIVYLILPKSLIPSILPALKKYALFSKVSIEDKTEDFFQWGRVGNKDSLNLSDFIFTVNAEQDRFWIISSKKQIEIELMQKDIEAWKLLDIQALQPEIWLETTEKFLPHHLNLVALGAVSFTKGCYCGQEIVARMEHKGKTNYQLKMHSLPLTAATSVPGTKLDIGTVVTNSGSQVLTWNPISNSQINKS